MGDELGRTTRWYYCLRHATVEPEGQCKATDRLGPYPDPESAAHALEMVRAREEQWKQEDREWAGEEPPGGHASAASGNQV